MNQEVWVDFDWAGVDASAGDFFRPFRTLAEAVVEQRRLLSTATWVGTPYRRRQAR
jgi:hypothetical protein